MATINSDAILEGFVTVQNLLGFNNHLLCKTEN